MEKGCRGNPFAWRDFSFGSDRMRRQDSDRAGVGVYFFAACECKKKYIYFISFFAFITRNDKCNAELTYSKMYKKRILSKTES